MSPLHIFFPSRCELGFLERRDPDVALLNEEGDIVAPSGAVEPSDVEGGDAGVIAAAKYDNGRGIIIPGHPEPLYGDIYLPRKFKIAVTVPGDNSVDIYISDIGLVVITDDNDELLGFNVMVGGGMGRWPCYECPVHLK